MDHKIQQLEAELQEAKRQKKEQDKLGTLEGLVDEVFGAWGRQLEQNASTTDDTKKYVLMLYAPAGPYYRYDGLLQSIRYLALKHPWTIEQYANSETTSWDPKYFWADRKEDLIPPSYKLLWAVGVTFFIVESDSRNRLLLVEADYERPVLFDKRSPTSIGFDNGQMQVNCDLTTEEGIEHAFALTTRHAIYGHIDKEIEVLESKIAAQTRELEKKKEQRKVAAEKPRPFPL